jgi:hypothetical protein
MQCAELRVRVSELTGRRNEVRASHARATAEVERLTKYRAHLEQAQIIIQTVAQITQDQLEYRVSELTSCALAAIFPRPYTMRVLFERKRGRTECALTFGLPNGAEVEPMDASGFGPVDVASFGLRLTGLSIQKPRKRPVVVLDEPFKFVSKDLLPRVSALIHELSAKLGIQFIIITHEDRLIEDNDNVFRVKLIDGVSKVAQDGGVEAAEIGAEPAVQAEEEFTW